MSRGKTGSNRWVRVGVVSVVVCSALLPSCGGSGGSGEGSGGSQSGVGGRVSSGGGGEPADGGAPHAGGGMASGGRSNGGGPGDGGAPGAGGGNVVAGGSENMAGSGAGGIAGDERDILVPKEGALLGLYYGDESLRLTSAKLGQTPPLHLTYYGWEDEWTQGETVSDLKAGRIPFVNWELYDVLVPEILQGTYDAVIQARAEEAAALKEPFFLDLGAEMNGDWSPWGGAQNGMSADAYLALYRKVHDAFILAGALNVIWAFCPNVTDVPKATWNEALDYYPGDDYVDWMCVDGYNWGGAEWQTFSQVFADIYPLLAAKRKPIMIGEMASSEKGGDKATFISGIVPTLKTQYPEIRGLIWFDINKEEDWRISSSAESEAAFQAMAQDEYFNP